MATLITGATSGIGEEFTHRYAAQKHDLVLVARNKEKLNALADEMRTKHEIEVTVISLDLFESDASERLWSETTRVGLEIDVLVNNAGFGTSYDVADDDPERLEQEVRLNCLTVVGLTARYLPAMRQRRQGTIINISSAAAFQPMPHMAVTVPRNLLCSLLQRHSGVKQKMMVSEYLLYAPDPQTLHFLRTQMKVLL